MSPIRPNNTIADWRDPEPLPTPPRLPYLDRALIPDALRPWITDAADRYGVPAEVILVPALIAAGTAAGNTMRVFPKANDESWSEAPNLYGLLVAQPSTKKSPALKEGLRWLNRLEARRGTEWAKDAAWRRTEAQAAASELKAIANALTEEQDSAALLDLRKRHDTAQKRLDAATGGPRRYMVNDATVEKAAMLLADEINRSGLLLVRDEFSGLLAMMRRSGHENDRSFYLEGYNGTGSYVADRVSRESTSIPVFTLSMLGTIQPTQIAPIVQAARRQHVDDGFIERFQATVWIDADRCGPGRDEAPYQWAIDNAARAFDRIATQAAKREEALGRYEFEGIHYTAAAQQHVDEWNRLRYDEAREANREGHVAYASHLGKSQAALARIALIYHLLDAAEAGKGTAISLETATTATKLMDFFQAHARRTYDAHLPPSVDVLVELRNRIQSGTVEDGMSLRDFQRGHPVFGRSREEQLEVLQAAEERHWLRLEKVANRRARPSTIIRLNPHLLAD